MALDPNAKKILDMLATAGIAKTSGFSARRMRDGFHRMAMLVDDRHTPVGKIIDGQLPSPAGPLRTRSYVPQGPLTERMPGLVYFHGGGGIFGSIETHEGLCRMLANESGCKVIVVGYRQAPEHKFPAVTEDCYAATVWIFEHAKQLGLDPKRIAVGGFRRRKSGGGGLPASEAK
jgi:acetyl esterase